MPDINARTTGRQPRIAVGVETETRPGDSDVTVPPGDADRVELWGDR
jgi:hypothetical protein